ncbi:MAG: sensor domain-containing diguanylate cyclase [Gammaproteobacteria bacterium]|nr:sensor domain-containing diguanylate cyclase [Gammaproteobacteria bacterium]
MKKPELPHDEQDRLETLRSLKILDSPAEERFDRLTRIAQRMFDVPIALINFVDEDRQWFKSRIGVDTSETPRDVSFCGHALLNDDILIVPNALEDDRFVDNPYVTGDMKIRFYAGYLLRAPNGQKLGTLCIIDRKPRDFSARDIQALRDLALTVERELALVEMATLDDLTNISNRSGFLLLAQHSLHLSRRQNSKTTLVFIDLDNFKDINDTHGHVEGDSALSAFTELLTHVCRSSDICARLGGDEFVLLLTNAAKVDAENTVLRLSEAVEQYNQESGHEYVLGFSCGIVEFDPDKHDSINDLLDEGDALMYQQKNSKR